MGLGHSPTIITDGLVFSLDAANQRCYSGSGLTAFGLIGGINGTLVNGVGFTTSNSGSFVFDGTDDYVTASSVPATFWTGGSWTVETFLLNNNSTSGDYGILGTASQLHLLIRNGYAHLGLFGNDVASNVQISTTNWTHITFQYNANNYNKLIYVNGSLSNSSIGTPINVNGASTQIGKVSWGYNYYFGKMANFNFYNKILSATEVKQNYNATKRRYGL
jgi:hypothetical protein